MTTLLAGEGRLDENPAIIGYAPSVKNQMGYVVDELPTIQEDEEEGEAEVG